MISVRPGGSAASCSSTLGMSGKSACRRLLPARNTSTRRGTSGSTYSPASTVIRASKPLSAEPQQLTVLGAGPTDAGDSGHRVLAPEGLCQSLRDTLIEQNAHAGR